MLFAGGACGHGDALVELSAADAIEALSTQTQSAIDEYHADLDAADAARHAAVVDAFVHRIRRDVETGDPAILDAHARAFGDALARLQADRQTAWERRARARDNVAELEGIARDMRRLALNSITLNDEWQRYLARLIEARRRAAGQHSSPPASGQPTLPR